MDISVYITSYNQRDYLVEAIESVLAQTLPPRQIIVVDDCSQDGSQEMIASYASRHPVIMPIFHEQNQGVARTRNDALSAVIADYVTYVDGDDRFLPTKLEKEARLLQSNSLARIAFSDVFHTRADGSRVGRWATREKPPQGYVFCQVFARDFPDGNLFRNELVDYRAWKQIGYYDPSLKLYEDYDMRIRLTKQLHVAYCDEPLSEYRKHSSSLRSIQAMQKVVTFDRICEKNRPLLEDLDPRQKRYLERRLDRWRAHLLRIGAKEMLGAWQGGVIDRKRAMEMYLQSLKDYPYLDLDLILGLVLPHDLYSVIRSAAHKAQRREGGHGK
jgi:glycosyltransferase involved in cell wall biosynthesis